MNTKISFKSMLIALMAIVSMGTLTACSSDDDGVDNGNNNNGAANALIISGKNYGNLPYAQFMDWDDGYASFVFSNVRMANSIDQNAPLTFLSVRIPCSSAGIPTGTFSTDADADFDVNRIASTGICELTGWCLKLTMTVTKNGDNYSVDFATSDLHIFHNDDEKGNGEPGTLSLHYEGKIEVVNYN